MWPQPKAEYSAVSPSDSSSDVDSEKETYLGEGSARWSNRSSSTHTKLLLVGTILNVLLFVVTASMLVTWRLSRPSDLNHALRQSSFYSPLLDMIDLDWHPVTVQGDLYPPEDPSIARQMPNPEADLVWDEWEITRTFPITAEQVRQLGKDPALTAKFDDDYWHLGDDAYMAQIDVFHQLHCLNTMRRVIYGDYYNVSQAHSKHPEMFFVHLNHCIDILMQGIQCSGNVGLITLNWMETQKFPFPDFSINRQCIDFEKLVDFRKDITVDIDKWKNMTKPEGVREVPAPAEYYKIFNVTDHHADHSKGHGHDHDEHR